MVDLETVIRALPGDQQFKTLEALKILVDFKVLSLFARANGNQLVEMRMDSSDEDALVREIREVRQTNRVLLGLEESAKQLTKGMEDE